jgi:integrase
MQEVCGLKVRAIDFLRRTVTVELTVNEVEGKVVYGEGKTLSSARTIQVPSTTIELLAEHLRRTGHLRRTDRTDPEAFVLQSPDGGPMRRSNFRVRIYNPALKRAGLPPDLTPHRLRHSTGDYMRENGESLETIQKRLGHASIRTTADIYGSLNVAVDKAASLTLCTQGREDISRTLATPSPLPRATTRLLSCTFQRGGERTLLKPR